MSVALAIKVISKVKNKRRFKTQPNNRELIIIIKCVNNQG